MAVVWTVALTVRAAVAVVFYGFCLYAGWCVVWVWDAARAEACFSTLSADDAAVCTSVAIFFHPLFTFENFIDVFVYFESDAWYSLAFNAHYA